MTLNKHWDEVKVLLTAPMVSRFGYVDEVALWAALSALRNGRLAVWVGQLWRVIFLEVWLRDVVERGIIAGPS